MSNSDDKGVNIMSEFKDTVSSTFRKHGLEDEKLELVVADLFNSFESHLLRSTDLVKFVQESMEREDRIRKSFR